MKLATLKAIIISIVTVAAISVGVVFSVRFERSREAVPEGAGSRTVSETAVPEVDALPDITPSATFTPEPAEQPAQERYGEGVDVVSFKGQDYVRNEDISTLLLIGVDDDEMIDSKGYRNDALADFLVVAVLNNADKTCTLLQINRNTMTNVTAIGATHQAIGYIYQQIALAHSYGDGLEESCEYTVDAVSRLLYDTPIDNYLSMAMGGINILNEKVGGVTVTIEDDFSNADPTLVQGETITLHGDQAEHFVRARMNMADDSNPARQRRQRAFIEGLVAKLREDVAADAGFAIDLYASLADYLVTDCDINELGEYSESLSEYELSGFITPEGETKVHQLTDYAEFYPDDDALQQLVIDTFYVPYEAPEAETPVQSPVPTGDAPLTESFGLNTPAP